MWGISRLVKDLLASEGLFHVVSCWCSAEHWFNTKDTVRKNLSYHTLYVILFRDCLQIHTTAEE